MSGKKFVLFISIFLLIVLVVVFYFFVGNKKENNITPPVLSEKTPAQIAEELRAFRPDSNSTKTPVQIQKELASFKAPALNNTVTKKQIFEDLKNVKP